jgi:hypothetical protein
MNMAADDPAIRDTIEGESDLPELAAWALRERRVLLAEVEGIKLVIADLQKRIERKEAAADKINSAVAEALHEAGYSKGKDALRLPDMTITVAQKSRRNIDESVLPNEFWKTETQIKPDLDAIKAALDAKQIIPGVTFSNAAPSITIRGK